MKDFLKIYGKKYIRFILIFCIIQFCIHYIFFKQTRILNLFTITKIFVLLEIIKKLFPLQKLKNKSNKTISNKNEITPEKVRAFTKEIAIDKSFDDFYYVQLPKFVEIFKSNLSNELDKKNNLTVGDYITIFFEFYQFNSVYEYFNFLKPDYDELYFNIYLNKNENKIHLERSFWFQNIEDTYHIEFELMLNNPSYFEGSFDEDFLIERNSDGSFENDTKDCSSIEEYKEKVFSSTLLSKFLNEYPISMSLKIEVDA
jgi:hypothetical protein